MITRFFNKVHDTAREVAYRLRWRTAYVKSNKSAKKLDVSGEKIIIVGNGPSTAEFDFDKYAGQGYNFLCVNFFACDEEKFQELKPKYYCIVDPIFYGMLSRPPNKEEAEKIAKLKIALESVDWEMTFVQLEEQEPFFNNSNIKIV